MGDRDIPTPPNRITREVLTDLFDQLCVITGEPTDGEGEVRLYKSAQIYRTFRKVGDGNKQTSPYMSGKEAWYYLQGAIQYAQFMAYKAEKEKAGVGTLAQ